LEVSDFCGINLIYFLAQAAQSAKTALFALIIVSSIVPPSHGRSLKSTLIDHLTATFLASASIARMSVISKL